jgi:hypothetical protein
MPSIRAPQQQEQHCHATIQTVRCFAVILRDADREVLLEHRGDSLSVPAFELPKRQRTSPHLVPAVRQRFGVNAACRFKFTLTPGEPTERCVVLDAHEIESPQFNHSWVSTETVPWNRIQPEIVRETLRSALSKTIAYNAGSVRGRFVQPGWFAEVLSWVRSSAASHGVCLSGPWLQYSMGPDFSLICFKGCEKDLWFKAVDRAGHREFRVTHQLAACHLPHLASLLAFHEDWRGWLTLGCPGRPLDGDATQAEWISAARALAELQRASLPYSWALLEAGCQDLRAPALEEAIDPFLSRLADLFDRQQAETVRRLSLADLRLIEQQLKACCRAMDMLALPATLGHSDLNPGNVLVDGGQVVFLDWMQGHVGNPLLTFEFLLALCRRFRPGDEALIAALRLEYLRGWQSSCQAQELEHCSELSPLLAPFAFALNFLAPAADQEERPEVAALLRSLARRMYVEAERHVSSCAI